MSEQTQNYGHHKKFVPLYHFGILPVLLVHTIVSAWHLMGHFSLSAAFAVLVAAALLGAALYGRIFALHAQDRLIRLEERQRLARLCSGDMASRIESINERQLIALRFASDSELPGLAQQVVDGKLTDPDAIKKSIQSWRVDAFRC